MGRLESCQLSLFSSSKKQTEQRFTGKIGEIRREIPEDSKRRKTNDKFKL